MVQGCGIDSAPGCTDGCLYQKAYDEVLDITDGAFFFFFKSAESITISAEDNSTGC